MKIFADLHHQSLTKSLKILFEDRLGHTLYFPHGREWFEQGYWKLAEPYGNFPGTIDQYLTAPPTERVISLEDFIKGDFDIVIASYNDHVRPYYKLIKKHNLKAKLVVQIGNMWEVDWNITDNLLASVKPFNVPSNKNVVFYHQEFDKCYEYEEPSGSDLICSFVSTLQHADIFKQDWLDFQELEKLPYEFKSYGSSCRDGVVLGDENIARIMKDSKFGVHFKHGGDGYGHILHSWFAVGRPVIFKGSQYKGKLAGDLLIDGKTGFDWELGGVGDRIKNLTKEEYLIMCENVRQKFNEVVKFDKEAEDIKQFLSNLL